MSFLYGEDIRRILENSDVDSEVSELEDDYVFRDNLSNDDETIENIENLFTQSNRDEGELVVVQRIQDVVSPLEQEVQTNQEDVIDEGLQVRSNRPTPVRRRRATQRNVSVSATSSSGNWNVEVTELERELFIGHLLRTKQSQLFDTNTTVFTIFRSIITDEVIKLMTEQTNLYAERLKEEATLPHSRIRRWYNVDEQEMLKFIGVILLTGLISYPTLESYWKSDILYHHPLLHQIGMSYNRFVLLLRCWHFADNLLPNIAGDRIYKIRPFLNMVLGNIRNIYTADEVLVVDESMVSFRGRLLFRQYIPSKAHKYGIKIYKLCTADGYTLGYQIYYGESEQVYGLDTSGSIVIKLAEEYLDEGRLMVTDNFYTSIPLAEFLKNRKTDLLGTVNKKRRGLPKEVIQAPLRAGEISVQQRNKVTVLKWHDKRDVTMLSTCHGKEMAMSGGRNPKLKPRMVLDYNKGKKGIDLADQLASYNSPIRKTVIWYKKIAIDLLSISIVNSMIIYNEFHPQKKDKCTILSAYEQIIKSLLDVPEIATVSQQVRLPPRSSPRSPAQPGPSRSSSSSQHFLIDLPKYSGKKAIRKRCVGCYKRLLDEGHSTSSARIKAKKVHQQCKTCKKGYCYFCFEQSHK